MAKNMTQGNIFKCLVQFSVPLVLSGLLQQLYSWADAFIVGRVEGEVALGAVGATGSISNFYIMLITGFALGLSILAAGYFGKGETKPICRLLSTFTMVFGVLFSICALLCVWNTEGILHLMNTPQELFDLGCVYLKVVFWGMPCLAIYNVYAAILRGMGDSRASFLSIVVSAVTNVALDLVFVAGFRLGVRGAAIATVIAQAMMVVFIIGYTVRAYPELRFRPSLSSVQVDVLREGAKLGIPTALQSGVSSFGGIILQNFMNGFGRVTVTAITTAYRVDTLIMLPIINLGAAISTVVAQNLGCGDRERVRKAFGVGILMEMGIALMLTLLMVTCGGYFVAFFGVSQEVAAVGAEFFRKISWFYLAFGLAVGFRGCLDGTGDVVFTGVSNLVSLALRIFLSYRWKPLYGNMVIVYAEACAWCVWAGINALRFVWKNAALKQAEK